MKIGFIGLGKLGLPTAVGIASKGHDVVGYDVDPSRMSKDPPPFLEAGFDGTGDFATLLKDSTIRFGDLKTTVNHGAILFVAVQTPHSPEYDGTHRIPDDRVDFDYSFLRLAIQNIMAVVDRSLTIVIISTVLPGTIDREIRPLIKSESVSIVYNPSFIAMGTVLKDYFNPEFILVGSNDDSATREIRSFYKQTIDAPIYSMSIASAELTKVAYNTFISTKICFANTVMEICHSIPSADCDDVMEALKNANVRLISPRYLTSGMGDGGGCHPRDNIAMSHLARGIGLSFDMFDAMMTCREKQASWLARILVQEARRRNCSIIVLGIAFKNETNLTDGSPAILVANILKESSIDVVLSDDSVGTSLKEDVAISRKSVFLIGCRHPRYANYTFGKGSFVLDPHRYIPDGDGYDVIRIGSERDRTVEYR